MRGSTPLDVAAASCIDNNELALALQEQDLEMVCEHFKSQDRKSNERVELTLDLLTSAGDVGGDVPGGLRTADVSDAPG